MGLASSLVSLGDGTLPASFAGLKSHLDLAWVEDALARKGVATVRRRKLPSDQVVWLAIGMALYRDRPIPEVVHRLNLVLPDKNGNRQSITKGGITAARNRVGSGPLEELFQMTARHWALESADRYRWRELMVLGADGTTLRVPDSAENRETFHLPGHNPARRSSAYPQIRVAGLMVLRSHVLLDFDFCDCKTGEGPLTKPLIERVPDQSLTIMDRNFIDYPMLCRLRANGQQRHWLVRGKKSLKWTVLRQLGRQDQLVEIKLSPKARAENPDAPKTFVARVLRYRRKGFRPSLLLTSLVDERLYPASEIVELYHERWEIELGYDEIKTHTLERLETIRSETPEGVRQEVWGMAVAYNLVRREMEAMALEWELPPRRISFRGSLMLIRDLFIWAATASPGSLPKMVKGMRLDMEAMILPKRRSDRRYPRWVKMQVSHYPRNAQHPA